MSIKEQAKKVTDACRKLCDLGYVGFCIFARYGETEIFFGNNCDDYKEVAQLIAKILNDCAPQFSTTPDEFLKAVEEEFKLEAEAD